LQYHSNTKAPEKLLTLLVNTIKTNKIQPDFLLEMSGWILL